MRKKLAGDKSTIFILTLVPIHKKDRHLQIAGHQGARMVDLTNQP